jgi:hypothetical protein
VGQHFVGQSTAELYYVGQQEAGHHTLGPTTRPTTMKMSKEQGRHVTLQDMNIVIARAVDVDKGLPVIAVQVGEETLKNVLLDGGSGVNFITEEEHIWLGLPTPLPDPYQLCMTNQVVV